MIQGNLHSLRLWERIVVPGWYAAIAITVLGSLWPKPPTVMHVQSDKLLHFIVYLVLAFIPACWFYPVGRVKRAVLFLFVLGAVLEVGQLWSPGRYFEWADMAANIEGTCIGLILGMTALRMVRPA
jgi:VanZ family protein